MTTLSKTCPVCHHEWVIKHDRWGMGEIFLRINFSIFMFDHLQSHTGQFDESRLTAYEHKKASV